MNEKIIYYLKDGLIIFVLIFSLLLNISLWIYLSKNLPSPSIIILHYNISYGIDILGEKREIFTLPLIGIILLILNLILGYFFYFRERLVAYLLSGIAVLNQVLLWLAGVLMVMINNIK